MSTNRVIIDAMAACDNIDSFAQVFCLPVRENCTPGCRDTVLVNCGDTYNCNRGQGEKIFYIPYVDGDKIQFQLPFIDDFNTDQENPTVGWGVDNTSFMVAELYDETATLVSSDSTTFSSRRMVAWSGDNSYQIIEIDTSLIASNCFSLKFIAYNAAGDETDSLCTQDFKQLADCHKSLLIRSENSRIDCCNNYYGSPAIYVGDLILYDNSLRYAAQLIDTGGGYEKTTFTSRANRINSKVELTFPYEISFSDAIPTFLKNHIYKIHLSGERLFIDNHQYFTGELNIENQAGCMWWFRVPVSQYCQTNFKC